MAHTTHKALYEHKRSVSSPRLVKMMGADARMAVNDEPDDIDRGPLPEVSESDWAAFEVARNVNKAERLASENIQHAKELDLQMLDAMRRAGL